jgi:hypothetical protein
VTRHYGLAFVSLFSACWFIFGIGRSWSRFIEAQRGRDEAAIGKRCPDGRQKVGSEPRLNDIAEPARIECGLGEVGVFVDREEDQARRPVQAPESARRFDAVEPRHGDVEHDDIRMESLRLKQEFASVAHGTDDETFTRENLGRQREHCRMIIGQEHAQALRGAGVGNKGSGGHGAIYRRCWKSPILSKLTVLRRTLAALFQHSMLWGHIAPGGALVFRPRFHMEKVRDLFHRTTFTRGVAALCADALASFSTPGFHGLVGGRGRGTLWAQHVIRCQCVTNLYGSADSSILKKLKCHFLGQANTAM